MILHLVRVYEIKYKNNLDTESPHFEIFKKIYDHTAKPIAIMIKKKFKE